MTDLDDETTMPGVQVVETVHEPRGIPGLAIVFFGKAAAMFIILILMICGRLFWGWDATPHHTLFLP